MLRSEKMKYDIHVNESNVAVNIPLTLDYRLMTDAEAAGQKRREEEQSAKLKAEIAARAAADKPRPLAPGETESILRDLRSADEHRVQDAARRLSKTMPTRYPLELFSRPLCAAYKNKNEWTRAALMAALRIWATRDAEQTVIEGSRNASFMVRNEAIPALGKFKTAAAAEAAAAQAAHNQREVETAMKAMGPVAEPAAISLLENSDFWVRGVAANVLAEIGGKRALAALRERHAPIRITSTRWKPPSSPSKTVWPKQELPPMPRPKTVQLPRKAARSRNHRAPRRCEPGTPRSAPSRSRRLSLN